MTTCTYCSGDHDGCTAESPACCAGKAAKIDLATMLGVAARVAVSFPSLTESQCIYAARKACTVLGDVPLSDLADYALDLARDADDYRALAAQSSRDCDRSF